MSIASGASLTHHRLVEPLGAGGMGVVWKALDLSLDRLVAIKILPEAVAADRDWRERLEREARALAALDHPNIVTVYSVERDGGQLFLTMELVRGRTLAAIAAAAPLPAGRLFEVAVPLADALAAAHERGLVHRDLKPANVMVTDDGRVKVLDFGLAQRPGEAAEARGAAGRGAAGRVPSGAAVEPRTWASGTPAYMAPEQLRGEACDVRSDLFALGLVLFEIAAGRHPFEAAGAAAGGEAAAILNEPPAPLAASRPDLPAAFARLVGRCLEKDPARRPGSAREVHRELLAMRGRAGAAGAEPPSIAVLPFVDLSPARDQSHLGDGIADELILVLAGAEGVRVASRSSSFRFRSGALGPREAGLELGVDYLLEGTVRAHGGVLRVTASLTGVRDGLVRWSERWERPPSGVFEVQESIARSIAEALEVPLGAAARDVLARPMTRSVEAYECYLRGRRFFFEYGRRAMDFALDQYERAIALDPGFALAHAGVADCHAFRWLYVDHADASRRRADEASRRALELAPEVAQCHVSRGLACSLLGDHDGAGAEFERALGLHPRLFDAYYFFARDRFAAGEPERAVALYERACELRPDDYQAPLLVAQIHGDLGRPAAAESARRRGVAAAEAHLAAHPDDVRALYMAANGLVALGEVERGLGLSERAMSLDPDDSMLLYNVACIRAMAGRVEPALDCLERAVRMGLVQREWIESDSNLAPLRGHPRYAGLLRWLEAGGE